MKVFDGFRLTSDSELTDAEIAAARKLAVDTRLEAEARGLVQHKKRIRLEGGGYAYAEKAGDYLRVHVVPDRGESKRREIPDMPDWGSGWAVDGNITTVNGVGCVDFVPTEDTVARLTDIVDPGFQPVARFAQQSEMRPRYNSDQTQYASLRASMYSGRMQELVQYLLGYGKPPRGPNAFSGLLPAAELAPGEQLQPDADIESAYNNGVSIEHSWRWNLTHGLAQGPNNTWWVIEVGERGVLAMPLPYFRGTQTQGFKTRASAIDTEVAKVIETFGGLPTGGSIPGGDLFEPMLRAGLVKQIVPKEDLKNTFYKYEVYPNNGGYTRMYTHFTSHGWTFNYSGTEAHNVTYGENWPANSTTSDRPLLWTEHWKATFEITEVLPTPQLTPAQIAARGPLMAKIRAVSNDYTNSPSTIAKHKKILVEKLRWLSDAQVAATATMLPEDAFDYVDAQQVNRYEAVGAVTRLTKDFTQMSMQYGDSGYDFLVNYTFKAWEPLPTSYDADVSDGILHTYIAGQPVAPSRYVAGGAYVGYTEVFVHSPSAVVFVYFIGDTLKTVRYYSYQDDGESYWPPPGTATFTIVPAGIRNGCLQLTFDYPVPGGLVSTTLDSQLTADFEGLPTSPTVLPFGGVQYVPGATRDPDYLWAPPQRFELVNIMPWLDLSGKGPPLITPADHALITFGFGQQCRAVRNCIGTANFVLFENGPSDPYGTEWTGGAILPKDKPAHAQPWPELEILEYGDSVTDPTLIDDYVRELRTAIVGVINANGN